MIHHRYDNIITVFIIAGSRRASHLFCAPDLDVRPKVNRSTNPGKPMRIHFHSNYNILKGSRRVGQCTRFSNLKFCIIRRLTNMKKKNSRYGVKRRAASEWKWILMKTCFDQLHLRFDANRP